MVGGDETAVVRIAPVLATTEANSEASQAMVDGRVRRRAGRALIVPPTPRAAAAW
jgi:hypothetical protein